MDVKTLRTVRPLLELERFLPYRLNVVAEGVSRALSRLYAERYGIGIPEWRVIATLGQYDRMTAKQVGVHSRGRASHGHAMIVDPWGTVLAQVGDGEGFALAELDFERQDRMRRELPALSHRRLGTGAGAGPAKP